METHSPNPFQNRLREKLVESLTAPIPEGTPRRIYGAVRFPGKVFAVVGIRRAGKTMFVPQIHRELRACGGGKPIPERAQGPFDAHNGRPAA